MVFVTDMQKAIDFYTDILELTLRFRSPNWSEVGDSVNSVFLGLHLSNKDQILNDLSKNTPEVTFSVRNVEKIQKQLLEKGVKFTRLVTEISPGQFVTNFTDIDGNKLALHETKP